MVFAIFEVFRESLTSRGRTHTCPLCRRVRTFRPVWLRPPMRPHSRSAQPGRSRRARLGHSDRCGGCLQPVRAYATTSGKPIRGWQVGCAGTHQKRKGVKKSQAGVRLLASERQIKHDVLHLAVALSTTRAKSDMAAPISKLSGTMITPGLQKHGRKVSIRP